MKTKRTNNTSLLIYASDTYNFGYPLYSQLRVRFENDVRVQKRVVLINKRADRKKRNVIKTNNNFEIKIVLIFFNFMYNFGRLSWHIGYRLKLTIRAAFLRSQDRVQCSLWSAFLPLSWTKRYSDLIWLVRYTYNSHIQNSTLPLYQRVAITRCWLISVCG